MKPFRAFAFRPSETLRSERIEREVSDLSTFSDRLLMRVHSDAVLAAPPQGFWTRLAGPVPGLQIAGTLPGDSWGRYLLRVPTAWNGRLVIAGSPGLCGVRGYDLYWADKLLQEGCAFACTDKGLRVAADGDLLYVPQAPECGLARWYPRLKALAELSRVELRRARGRVPGRTYAVGVSNGGYLARCAVERDPSLFDGAVEVSGVLWTAQDNLLSQLPAALRAADAQPLDRAALRAAGYPAEPQNDGLLALCRGAYWEPTLLLCLGDLDPDYGGPLQDYDLSARRAQVSGRLAATCLTGRLAKPLISLAGGLDFLITCRSHAVAYRDLVASAGCSALHRLRVRARATHVDKDCEFIPGLDPLMPHAHRAFDELVAWVERGEAPPADSHPALETASA
ncbi:MAG: hypothetical protein A2X36_16045 [Elusimicrobia bacterium GWA2_69_24]|nr:MAG: hypothetical protein A2X36_16045 [Elusimicrobia bacterium GWA2_69_24]HBL16616.1 hypothetical protein [Elusimicrobiota bacterium]